MSENTASKIRRIENALKTCAKIVVLYGETYYPIFERLEKELEAAKKENEVYHRALKYVSDRDHIA